MLKLLFTAITWCFFSGGMPVATTPVAPTWLVSVNQPAAVAAAPAPTLTAPTMRSAETELPVAAPAGVRFFDASAEAAAPVQSHPAPVTAVEPVSPAAVSAQRRVSATRPALRPSRTGTASAPMRKEAPRRSAMIVLGVAF
ncbi:MAG: hypothetical protein J0H62_09100 [Rhizobiales bacterium]|nr:hypothetical protein [Hyphomicrobiales bacterium]